MNDKTNPAHNPVKSMGDLPDEALVRQASLVSTPKRVGLLGVSSATLWRWVKDGVFPKPMKLSANVTAWRMGDVREWLAAKAQA